MTPKSIGLSIGAVLLGALASEGFTRVIVEPDAFYGIEFSAGAKRPDPKYGFVFTPNWEGYMRHEDRVWGIPIRLNEHGYRLPGRSELTGEPTRVLLLGGRSMTMCYGLPDHRTIQSCMARQAERPLEVHNTGWAGVDPYRTWHYFLDTLDQEVDFDVVLFCLNPSTLDKWAQLPEGFEIVERHPVQDLFFHMLPDNVRVPKDDLEMWMGRNYYKSYVGFGLLRYREYLARATRTVKGWLEDAPPPAPPVEPATVEEGRERFLRFVEHVEAHFAEKGARLAFVYMPSWDHPVDAYDNYEAVLPERFPRIDLQRKLRPQMELSEFIALGHLNAEHVERVASELNAFVESILESGE